MYSTATWHASGLRWIASLFNGAAGYLEQRQRASRSAESSPHPRFAEDCVDNARVRIYLRGF